MRTTNDMTGPDGGSGADEGAMVRLSRPARQVWPVVVSSPHSGRAYPAEFLAASRLDPLALRRSEDAFVDELAGGLPGRGVPTLSARFPRAWLDVNREPWELDPQMFDGPLPAWANRHSPQVRAGLGTLPRVVAGGVGIYRGPLPVGEAWRRIRRAYWPYHDMLTQLLDDTCGLFATACLVDCHSMPSGSPDDAGPIADVVLGDRFGRSCAPCVTAAASETLRAQGLAVRHNAPYAGGFITARYGRPEKGRHAIQIEVNRALYMHEATLQRGPGMKAVRRMLETVVLAVAAAVLATTAARRAAQ